MKKDFKKALVLFSLTGTLLISLSFDYNDKEILEANNRNSKEIKKDASNIEEIAKIYYRALYALDFKTVKEVASPNLAFRDPTAPAGYPAKKDGLDNLIKLFKEVLPPLNIKIKITRSYASNGNVVICQELTGVTDASMFEVEGDKIEYKMYGVTVLHVENGLVVSHTDYMDYKGMLKSVKPVK